MPSISLITFTSEFNKRTHKRLKFQCSKLDANIRFNYFTSVDLNADFKSQHSTILNKKCRGYGFYIWKPQIILQALDRMNQGDILIYLDAGGHINYAANSYYQHIMSSFKEEKIDIVAYQAFPLAELRSSNKSKYYVEMVNKYWISHNVLQRFKNPMEARDKYQIFSGVLVIKKTKTSYSAIRRWLNLCEDYNLLLGRNTGNNTDLKNHQLDMACLNLALDEYKNIQLRSYDEVWLPSNRSPQFNERLLKFSVFWMKRDFGLLRVLKFNLKNQIKNLINLLK